MRNASKLITTSVVATGMGAKILTAKIDDMNDEGWIVNVPFPFLCSCLWQVLALDWEDEWVVLAP